MLGYSLHLRRKHLSDIENIITPFLQDKHGPDIESILGEKALQ